MKQQQENHQSPAASLGVVNALSFDVEEYFHVHAFKGVIRQEDWDSYESRVVPSTQKILSLLETHDTKATFFVLGWVAERHPDLVRQIADGGHEIASHGYAHEAVYELTQEGFARDLERAGEAILSACPQAELNGYRAPSFSINESTPWAFEELKRLGFQYDSSLSPATTHDRYGVRGTPRFAHEVTFGLIEIPPSTIQIFGQNLPVAGGGHFRLAPIQATRWAIKQINQEGYPVVTYLHPWEFDPEQPRIIKADWKSRFRHYVNIHRTEPRLDNLLPAFPFGRMGEVFEQHLTTSDTSDLTSGTEVDPLLEEISG